MNKCEKCGCEFEGNFCPECGTRASAAVCPVCGNSVDANAKFCNGCGAELNGCGILAGQNARAEADTASQPDYFLKSRSIWRAAKYLPVIIAVLYALVMAAFMCSAAALVPMYGLGEDENLGSLLKIAADAEILDETASNIAQLCKYLWIAAIVAAAVGAYFAFQTNLKSYAQKNAATVNGVMRKSFTAAGIAGAVIMLAQFFCGLAFLNKISSLDGELGGMSDFHMLIAGKGANGVVWLSALGFLLEGASAAACLVVAIKRPEFLEYNPLQTYKKAYEEGYSSSPLYADSAGAFLKPAPVKNPKYNKFSKYLEAKTLTDVAWTAIILPFLFILIGVIVVFSTSVSTFGISGGKNGAIFAAGASAVYALICVFAYLNRFNSSVRGLTSLDDDKPRKENKRLKSTDYYFKSARRAAVHIGSVAALVIVIVLCVICFTKASDCAADYDYYKNYEANVIAAGGAYEGEVYTESQLENLMDEAQASGETYKYWAGFYIVEIVYYAVVAVAAFGYDARVKKLNGDFCTMSDELNITDKNSVRENAKAYKEQWAEYQNYIEARTVYAIKQRALNDKKEGR